MLQMADSTKEVKKNENVKSSEKTVQPLRTIRLERYREIRASARGSVPTASTSAVESVSSQEGVDLRPEIGKRDSVDPNLWPTSQNEIVPPPGYQPITFYPSNGEPSKDPPPPSEFSTKEVVDSRKVTLPKKPRTEKEPSLSNLEINSTNTDVLTLYTEEELLLSPEPVSAQQRKQKEKSNIKFPQDTVQPIEEPEDWDKEEENRTPEETAIIEQRSAFLRLGPRTPATYKPRKAKASVMSRLGSLMSSVEKSKPKLLPNPLAGAQAGAVKRTIPASEIDWEAGRRKGNLSPESLDRMREPYRQAYLKEEAAIRKRLRRQSFSGQHSSVPELFPNAAQVKSFQQQIQEVRPDLGLHEFDWLHSSKKTFDKAAKEWMFPSELGKHWPTARISKGERYQLLDEGVISQEEHVRLTMADYEEGQRYLAERDNLTDRIAKEPNNVIALLEEFRQTGKVGRIVPETPPQTPVSLCSPSPMQVCSTESDQISQTVRTVLESSQDERLLTEETQTSQSGLERSNLESLHLWTSTNRFPSKLKVLLICPRRKRTN